MILSNRTPLGDILAALAMVAFFSGIGFIWRLIGDRKKSKDDEVVSPFETKCYEMADKEVKGKKIIQGLMAKALAESDGDTKKANARYVSMRARQLIAEEAKKESRKRQLRVLKWALVTVYLVAYSGWIYYRLDNGLSVYDTWWQVVITWSPVALVKALVG